MTELRLVNLSIPGAPLGEENPLPFFRDPAISTEIKTCESMPPGKKAYLGWDTAFRVLPYRMQDDYSRKKKPLIFHSVVLENEFLKATFLPELGGRLYSLIYKPEERELLHRNPVFQPANLAIRNAWFSGGIEWNIGQVGHTFTTCSPVFASAIQGLQGEPGLRLYEYERCKGLFWQIDFYLPPGFPFLVAYTRAVNPSNTPISMYWWTNIAVNERSDVRVLAPASQAIYIDFGKESTAYGITDLPGLPSLNGVDGTYATNSPFANEFFFQCDEAKFPWEAALDSQGQGLIEASTARLKYRKMFCWGTHAGGRHWQEFLSEPGQAYIEIQAGLAPTQVHGLPMPAQTKWDWTQIFGFLQADTAKVHGKDWQVACAEVEARLIERLAASTLDTIAEDCRLKADVPSQVILQTGAGWGALEILRRKHNPDATPIPMGFFFPESSLDLEQLKWIELLENHRLKEQEPGALPGEWMIQAEWEKLLENVTEHNWYSLLHQGVMRMERGDEAGARDAWLNSIRLQPSAWAYRNLAILSLRRREPDLALDYYGKAWNMASNLEKIPTALAIEYLQMLFKTQQYSRGIEIFDSLPAQVQESDRIKILRGQFALAVNDLETTEKVLQREYAVVREGELSLTDLWFELQTRREAARSGRPDDENLRREVKQKFPPPSWIDFRSVNV